MKYAATVAAPEFVQMYDWRGRPVTTVQVLAVFCPECERWVDVALAEPPDDPEHLISVCDECSARMAEEQER